MKILFNGTYPWIESNCTGTWLRLYFVDQKHFTWYQMPLIVLRIHHVLSKLLSSIWNQLVLLEYVILFVYVRGAWILAFLYQGLEDVFVWVTDIFFVWTLDLIHNLRAYVQQVYTLPVWVVFIETFIFIGWVNLKRSLFINFIALNRIILKISWIKFFYSLKIRGFFYLGFKVDFLMSFAAFFVYLIFLRVLFLGLVNRYMFWVLKSEYFFYYLKISISLFLLVFCICFFFFF